MLKQIKKNPNFKPLGDEPIVALDGGSHDRLARDSRDRKKLTLQVIDEAIDNRKHTLRYKTGYVQEIKTSDSNEAQILFNEILSLSKEIEDLKVLKAEHILIS